MKDASIQCWGFLAFDPYGLRVKFLFRLGNPFALNYWGLARQEGELREFILIVLWIS